MDAGFLLQIDDPDIRFPHTQQAGLLGERGTAARERAVGVKLMECQAN
jgi:hypothetical protein